MDLERLKNLALEGLEKVTDRTSLESWRITFLGRKSVLAEFLGNLGRFPEAERRQKGIKANAIQQLLREAYGRKFASLGTSTAHIGALDITQPGKKISRGHFHPITMTLRKMIEIFRSMGFEVAEGPDIETEYYNFDALHIPSWHPARDMWDTFWLKPPIDMAKRRREISVHQRLDQRTSAWLLRTHTSPVQIRYMETHQPPIRIIAPGRVFRHEATDARHDFDFWQLEGLMIGAEVSFANFKFVMESFLKQFFSPDTALQLRASYFPFTEPSFEILMSCMICKGKGKMTGKKCSVCGGEQWLEMGGAGMVHPQVLRNVGYNPERVQGFAFGIGPDRFAMIKHKISDIRFFRSGDLRFIKQF